MNKNTPTTTNTIASVVLVLAMLFGGGAQTFNRPTGTRPTATTTDGS